MKALRWASAALLALFLVSQALAFFAGMEKDLRRSDCRYAISHGWSRTDWCEKGN